LAPDPLLRLRRARLAAQRLSIPAATVEEAVVAAGGLQAQDEPAARLAVRARTTGATAAEVTRALEQGRLVRTWAMRGTLHLLPAADAAWLVPLLGPVFEARARRRLDELGLDPGTLARGVEVVRTVLEREGPQRRDDLIAQLADRGV
jgi:hypothetical protein